MNYSICDNDFILDQDRKYVLRVKDLPEDEKPRERLTKHGPDILSVHELLAIVLNVGTKKEEILAMTSRIIKEYGEKNLINEKSPLAMEKNLGIPLAKACQIIACFELGRRFFQKNNGGAVVIRTAKHAYDYLKDMRELPKEHLRGLYLNSRYRLVHDEVISIGSLTANIIHPREVFKPAIEYTAAAVIIAHNHPSGDIKPSSSDIAITNQLVEAGRIIGIELLDHIIIAKSKFASIPISL